MDKQATHKIELTTAEMELIHTLMYHMPPDAIRREGTACIDRSEREYCWGQFIAYVSLDDAYRSLACKLDTVVRMSPKVMGAVHGTPNKA
jgi:hypothetical protein